MADNESKKIGDILDDIEKDLKKYAEDSFGEYGYSGKISELKSEIKKNLEKTKDTVDEQSYEENIRKLAKKLKNPDKAIGDYTNFEEMLNGVKKDAYKGVENLKQSSKAKSSSKSIDETNKKIGVKKRNRLMPTKIGKKTTLNIIGDGDEKNKIISKIHKYGLEDSVIMHGFLDKDGVGKVLSDSSIYVMSSYTESFGIVLLEAFSYGVPCVAFDSAEGANEIISNNWDGYLIKDRNIDEMAKRISHLIGNYSRRFIMGQNAVKKANKYSLEEVRDKWIKIIK